MIEVLRRVAAADAAADTPTIAICDERVRLTYGDLVTDAEILAAGLSEAGVSRFAIVSNDIPAVVALLAASSLLGAEACVYAPDITADALLQQARTLAHHTVVTTRDDLGDVGGVGGDLGDVGDLDLRPVADLRGKPAAAPEAELPRQRPLLVLTTGTTGAPRGVRHDWSRQLSRSARIRDGSGQVWLLAYGPQQFAGLQVLIHVFSSGATLVAPPVRRPQVVLSMIHDEGVDHISATPTFWRFLLAEIRADHRPPPALRQITLGGEAAPAGLLEDLSATFPDARISHIYAGSEFGSTGSVRDGKGGLPASLLARQDTEEVQLKIVDGELWIRSTATMLGYYGEDDLPDGEWWPTGDLVEVVGERIEFRGRASEVINVGGVKVHPLPVEARISAVPGVKIARVHGRPSALVGHIVVADVVADGVVDPQELIAAVRAACADLPRPSQPQRVRILTEAELEESLKGGKLVRGSQST